MSRPAGTQFSYILTVTALRLTACTYHGTTPDGLYRVMHIASLTGRPTGCHAAITALRQGLYRRLNTKSCGTNCQKVAEFYCEVIYF